MASEPAVKVIHEKAPPQALWAVRAGLFGLWGVKLLFDPVQDLAQLPVSAFAPPAPLMYLPAGVYPALLTAATLLTLRFLTVALLVTAASGYLFLWVSPLCCLLLTGYQSLLRGFGHINHAEIVPLLAVYALTVFAWADRLERMKRPAYPLVAIVAMLCLSYTLVGVHRVVHNGIGFFLSDAIECFIADTSLRVTYWDFGLGKLVLDYPILGVFMRLGFATTTVAEILAPFCLVSRNFRIAFLLVLVPFHIFSLLAMNIAFIENFLLLLLLLIDTSWWSKRSRSSFSRSDWSGGWETGDAAR